MKLLSQYKLINKNVLEIKDIEISSLKDRIFVLEQENRNRLPLPVIKVEEDDPDSSHLVDRRAYVSRVAGFHFDILNKKIKRMIADTREMMMSLSREQFNFSSQEFDIFLRGQENALWLIFEWGEMALSEKMSYEKGEDELNDEEVEDLKEKINKK